MAEECNHDCSSCGTTCGADTRPKDLHEAPHELSDIRHVIAVVSGKGGVGKSLVNWAVVCGDVPQRQACGHYGCRYYRPIHPKDVWCQW